MLKPFAFCNRMICTFLIILSTQWGEATDFLVTNNHLWFDPQDKTPVNIIVELKGADADEIVALLGPEFDDPRFKIADSDDDESVRITARDVFHSDIVRLNDALKRMESDGITALVPEIPLVVRVRDLEGQNEFISAVSGIPIATIEKIEAAVEEGYSVDDPLIFRYFMDNREHDDVEGYNELAPFYEGTILSFIPADTYGQMPLYIPGESVVFHSRVFHQGSVLGKYNPGLINAQLVYVLGDNKYIESLFWDEYFPGAMPVTRSLYDLIGLDVKITDLPRILYTVFPNGWVLKGVYESNSALKIVTDKVDIVNQWLEYMTSDFDLFHDEVFEAMKGFDEDDIYQTLQEHPNYLGWRINQYISNPLNAIVQERIRIEKEYRVDAVVGSVLKEGATLDRHNWLLEIMGLPFEDSPPEWLEAIDEYVQESVLEHLEPSVRETNFAFDIYLLPNDEMMIGESNPGSACGFMIENEDNIVALNHYLKKYPRLVQEGDVKGYGMTNQEQYSYIMERFNRWRIDPALHYKTLKFGPDGVKTLFRPIDVDAKYQM